MKKYEIELNGKTLSIQTGQVARQSSGSVIVQYGETTILTAVNAAKTMREDIDWFPLRRVPGTALRCRKNPRRLF